MNVKLQLTQIRMREESQVVNDEDSIDIVPCNPVSLDMIITP